MSEPILVWKTAFHDALIRRTDFGYKASICEKDGTPVAETTSYYSDGPAQDLIEWMLFKKADYERYVDARIKSGAGPSFKPEYDPSEEDEPIEDDLLEAKQFGDRVFLLTTKDKMNLPVGSFVQIDIGPVSYKEYRVIDWMTLARHKKLERWPKLRRDTYAWELEHLEKHPEARAYWLKDAAPCKFFSQATRHFNDFADW